MQTSLVGLSILWGLASFGVQGDFIESRDSVAPSWQAESRVEMEGYLIESLGEDRWVFDNGSESLLVSLPEGQWVSATSLADWGLPAPVRQMLAALS